MGGVPVEYMAETEKKAWVRFRYPRWMYDGPTLCGVPIEASRGFLKGWYAQNGVSLKNPRLGFVCVSEDMTGQFGLCGYFKEYDHELSEDDRLQFVPNELPPPFDADNQPAPPIKQWNALRLLKANRNYAVDYIRNGICELVGAIGRDRALDLGKSAARLTGLQNRHRLSEPVPKVADGLTVWSFARICRGHGGCDGSTEGRMSAWGTTGGNDVRDGVWRLIAPPTHGVRFSLSSTVFRGSEPFSCIVAQRLQSRRTPCCGMPWPWTVWPHAAFSCTRA